MATELVTKGTFDSASATAEWLLSPSGQKTVAGGRLVIANDEGGQATGVYNGTSTLSTAVTAMYRFKVDGFNGTSGGWTATITNGTATTTYFSQTFANDDSVNTTFTADEELAIISLVTGSATNLENSEFDNVSLQIEISVEGMAVPLFGGGEPMRKRRKKNRYGDPLSRRRELRDNLNQYTRMSQGPDVDYSVNEDHNQVFQYYTEEKNVEFTNKEGMLGKLGQAVKKYLDG